MPWSASRTEATFLPRCLPDCHRMETTDQSLREKLFDVSRQDTSSTLSDNGSGKPWQDGRFGMTKCFALLGGCRLPGLLPPQTPGKLERVERLMTQTRPAPVSSHRPRPHSLLFRLEPGQLPCSHDASGQPPLSQSADLPQKLSRRNHPSRHHSEGSAPSTSLHQKSRLGMRDPVIHSLGTCFAQAAAAKLLFASASGQSQRHTHTRPPCGRCRDTIPPQHQGTVALEARWRDAHSELPVQPV